ncbi:MAG: T9SS type A sorting domain-containing protein, partial [Saprospiraceae bacterium]|nr:T9SS type A sorting domain-containing protein [Saprospiraceae bacterium]
SDINPPTLEWTGSCSQGGTIDPPTPVVSDPENPNCPGTTHTYIYSVTDECSRIAEACTLVYTIVNDGIQIPMGETSMVSCFDAVVQPDPPLINDPCGNPVNPSGPKIGGTFNGCEGTYTFTWTYIDCAGVSNDWTYTYIIDLTTAPIAPEDVQVTVNCPDEARQPSPPSVNDACGNSIAPSGPVLSEVSCESISYVWTYTDCAGNSDTWTYTYLLTPPALDLNCPTPDIVSVEEQALVDAAFSNWIGQFSATGGCNTVVKYFVGTDEVTLASLNAPAFCGGSITVRMEVTSDCATDQCQSTFTAVATQQSFNITIPMMDMACFPGPNPPTAADLPPAQPMQNILALGILSSCINPLDVEMTSYVTGPVIVGNEYTFTRHYVLSHPLAVEEPTETFTFTWDPNPPVLSGLPEDITLPCGSELPEWPDVSAYDVEFGEAVVIPSSNQVGTSCGEKIQRTWTAYDGCGNSAVGVQIISLVDDEPPMLTVPPDTIIHCGEAIPAPYYDASDNCSNFMVELKESVTSQNECEYTLTRIWTARDGCYNVARDTQIIQVIDTTAPVIVPINPMLESIPNGGEMVMYGCINDPRLLMEDLDVYDACCTASYSVSDRLIASGVCDIFGYYRKWRCSAIATDPAGNTSEYYFYVLQYDTTAPVIYNVPEDLVLECGEDIPAADTTVFVEDDCSQVRTPQFMEEVKVDPDDSSKILYVRTWWAVDHCGNRGEASQTITVCGFDTTSVSSSLGNTVWEDTNLNGIQDQDEQGVNGINVYLYHQNPESMSDMILLSSETTSTINGKKGQFVFDHLAADQYQILFEIPSDRQFTEMNIGENDDFDSDADPNTGMTGMISLHRGEKLENIDAGLVPIERTVSTDISLLSFNVSTEKCSHSLSWSTGTEQGLASIKVLFSSNGDDFTELKDIDPMGGIGITHYAFTDPTNRSAGYYQIMLTDVNGEIQYSDLKKVRGRCIDNSNITVFPNPFREIFHIEFTAPETGEAEIIVIDRLGRIVQNNTIKTNQGKNKKEVNLKNLPTGAYMLEVRMNGWNEHQMLIKAE